MKKMIHLQNMTLPIHGMTCAACITRVENTLRELRGVSAVLVDLEANQVRFAYDPMQVEMGDILDAITSLGYSVATQEIRLQVTGMTCISCVAHVEGALQDLPGVIDAAASLQLSEAQVHYIPAVVTIAQMIRTLHAMGYQAGA